LVAADRRRRWQRILREDCVVVEADSQEFHKEWEQHVRDRNRDLLLAERGYPSLREFSTGTS
jgi:very-short-patch-repair endonuclease